MTKFYDLLTPALTTGTSDPIYYVSDVIEMFSHAHRTKFNKWIAGRDIIVVNDRGALYKRELEQFFESL